MNRQDRSRGADGVHRCLSNSPRSWRARRRGCGCRGSSSGPLRRGFVGLLMRVIVHVATWPPRSTGAPVFRSILHFSMPSRNFDAASACSGRKYDVTGPVPGASNPHLTNNDWGKRPECVAAFWIVQTLADVVLVHVTVPLPHLAATRSGPAASKHQNGLHVAHAVRMRTGFAAEACGG